eukprot:6192247-Pleurochrysis_carterae.AAC.1
MAPWRRRARRMARRWLGVWRRRPLAAAAARRLRWVCAVAAPGPRRLAARAAPCAARSRRDAAGAAARRSAEDAAAAAAAAAAAGCAGQAAAGAHAAVAAAVEAAVEAAEAASAAAAAEAFAAASAGEFAAAAAVLDVAGAQLLHELEELLLLEVGVGDVGELGAVDQGGVVVGVGRRRRRLLSAAHAELVADDGDDLRGYVHEELGAHVKADEVVPRRGQQVGRLARHLELAEQVALVRLLEAREHLGRERRGRVEALVDRLVRCVDWDIRVGALGAVDVVARCEAGRGAEHASVHAA